MSDSQVAAVAQWAPGVQGPGGVTAVQYCCTPLLRVLVHWSIVTSSMHDECAIESSTGRNVMPISPGH
jgi:hypothetical protein